MGGQEEAVEVISKSLMEDEHVLAIFLKGSMGRGEHDAYSDIDLYVLVEESHMNSFLETRLNHLRAYRSILFFEDYFIIAPQIIAVFDNLLHIDLFTVTEKTFKEKDYFNVIYDPYYKLKPFEASQNLRLTDDEFDDSAYDTAWFLFQYNKARLRGNDFWAVDMLRHVYVNVAKVLLHRYQPSRGQLGLKAIKDQLPSVVTEKVENSMAYATPKQHQLAVKGVIELLENEIVWIKSQLQESSQAGAFLRRMMKELN